MADEPLFNTRDFDCLCGHRRSEHDDAGGPCMACDCVEYRDERDRD